MTAPAKEHSVHLERMDASTDYQLVLTTFLPGSSRSILVSSLYTANTTTIALTVDDPTGASAPNVDDCDYSLQVVETSIGDAVLELTQLVYRQCQLFTV